MIVVVKIVVIKKKLDKAKLISYNGMNKYVIESDGITVLSDGDDNAYSIIDDMVYESEIDEWVEINEYKY